MSLGSTILHLAKKEYGKNMGLMDAKNGLGGFSDIIVSNIMKRN